MERAVITGGGGMWGDLLEGAGRLLDGQKAVKLWW